MKKESEDYIKIKVAISLRRLLGKRKENVLNEELSGDSARSYNQIAIIADIRKATVSGTFNAKHLSNFATVIMMIEAMGFTLDDFSKIYGSINQEEIERFKAGILP